MKLARMGECLSIEQWGVTQASLAIAVEPVGDQTTATYSMIGRTQQQYRYFKHRGSRIRKS